MAIEQFENVKYKRDVCIKLVKDGNTTIERSVANAMANPTRVQASP